MKRWSTVLDFIASGKAPTSETVVSFEGWAVKGDGGNSLWVKTGGTDTPSQNPTARGNNTLTDSAGFVYAPVDGQVFRFNGDAWFPSPFGDSGEGLYQFNGASWDFYDRVENIITTYADTATMQAALPSSLGQRAENRERGYAQYELKDLDYVPLPGDVTAANGRVWALQINKAANISWFESLDSALLRGVKLRGVDGETYTATDLTGVGGLEIDLNNATIDARSLDLSGVTGFKVSNGTFIYSGVDTGYTWLNMAGATSCEFHKVKFQSLPSDTFATTKLTSGANGNVFDHCEFYDCETSAIAIDGSSDGVEPKSNTVHKCRFEGGAFGVRMNNCTDNAITDNYTITGTGIELIGLQAFASNNVIMRNIAQLTGDNGISISGMHNTVVGNICQNNGRAGIWVWGSFNTVTGNICKNNMQDGGQWAGIGTSANFGGTGQFNVITGNVLDDDQPAPTQGNSIRFSGTAYVDWAAGQTIDTSSGSVYRVSGLKIYIATTSGTTGATAPTHDSGTVSDGGVSWRYVNTFVNEADAIFNTATPNTIGRSSGIAIVDQTGRNKYSDGAKTITDENIQLLSSGTTSFVTAVGDATNIDLRLAPKGAGRVSFGAVEAIGAQTVTGFIRIKDATGVQRLLAVVS